VHAPRSPLRRLPIVVFVWMLGLALAMPSALGGVPGTVTVVASGFSSPRGLALDAGDAFVVAEAGRGGSRRCGDTPVGEMCVGRSGRLTLVEAGDRERLARLSSIARPDGSEAFGTHDVAVSEGGALFATVGGAFTLETKAQFGRAGSDLGTLVRVSRSGRTRIVADLMAYEARRDPNGDGVESNPYGILRLGKSTIVTDAAGNSLLRVRATGRIRTLAVFPNRDVDFQGEPFSMDAVPTSVVLGPDGAYYVSELTGFPFPVGEARVYRVVPGEDPEVFATGFTNIIDIAFDADGTLYVVEIAHNSLASDAPAGAVISVAPNGMQRVVLDEGLFFPTSVAVMASGDLLVTNCGVCPGDGEVLQVVP
jgi:hypothetical protein